jgi:hypothetical protein
MTGEKNTFENTSKDPYVCVGYDDNLNYLKDLKTYEEVDNSVIFIFFSSQSRINSDALRVISWPRIARSRGNGKEGRS